MDKFPKSSPQTACFPQKLPRKRRVSTEVPHKIHEIVQKSPRPAAGGFQLAENHWFSAKELHLAARTRSLYAGKVRRIFVEVHAPAKKELDFILPPFAGVKTR